MKIKKSHFWYNQRQRNGIFVLAAIIILLQFIFFFVDFDSKETIQLNTSEMQGFEREIDSLNKIAIEQKKPRIYPFNPSFITDFKGYQLGMSVEEIDRLLEHRSNGKYINSIQEFQQVTKVSDSLLNIISPYFKFPDWIGKRQSSYTVKNNRSIKSENILTVSDINSATAEELKSIHGIGDKLSERIIKYRNRLGGFLVNDQLYEVYHLDPVVADKILNRFQILTRPKISKININEASFKEVLSIVYVDYSLTKKIFEYRDEVAEIQSLEELKQIEDFPIEKFDRIALYLHAK
ncbi:MAG: hypothetical protein HKN90_06850 [Flavobacteriaceae bacterium]|nr:hypothetical protein [Flavobacteriaceae bacterium]